LAGRDTRAAHDRFFAELGHFVGILIAVVGQRRRCHDDDGDEGIGRPPERAESPRRHAGMVTSKQRSCTLARCVLGSIQGRRELASRALKREKTTKNPEGLVSYEGSAGPGAGMDFIFEEDMDEVGSDIEAYCPKCKADTAHTVITKYEDE